MEQSELVKVWGEAGLREKRGSTLVGVVGDPVGAPATPSIPTSGVLKKPQISCYFTFLFNFQNTIRRSIVI